MKNTPIPAPLSVFRARKHETLIHRVIERDRRRCQMCGTDESRFCPYRHTQIVLSVAAIKPLNFGGKLVAENLMTVCSTCASGLQALAEESLFNRIKMRRRSIIRMDCWAHDRNRRPYHCTRRRPNHQPRRHLPSQPKLHPRP